MSLNNLSAPYLGRALLAVAGMLGANFTPGFIPWILACVIPGFALLASNLPPMPPGANDESWTPGGAFGHAGFLTDSSLFDDSFPSSDDTTFPQFSATTAYTSSCINDDWISGSCLSSSSLPDTSSFFSND